MTPLAQLFDKTQAATTPQEQLDRRQTRQSRASPLDKLPAAPRRERRGDDPPPQPVDPPMDDHEAMARRIVRAGQVRRNEIPLDWMHGPQPLRTYKPSAQEIVAAAELARAGGPPPARITDPVALKIINAGRRCRNEPELRQ